MNKVITINLNGVAYQLEEAGYEALRVYLGKDAAKGIAIPVADLLELADAQILKHVVAAVLALPQ